MVAPDTAPGASVAVCRSKLFAELLEHALFAFTESVPELNVVEMFTDRLGPVVVTGLGPAEVVIPAGSVQVYETAPAEVAAV